MNETENQSKKGSTTPEKIARQFAEGRDYWWQYTNLNGYAFRPNDAGLQKLSRNLDLNIPHLRRCINAFLEA